MDKDLVKFFELVEDQFQYGGKKYAYNDQRESTDVLFDDFGHEWLFGTMGKYVKRFGNLQRERDMLKIACYCYITWLKRGFHIDKKRTTPVDTNVETKTINYEEFKEEIRKYFERYDDTFSILNDTLRAKLYSLYKEFKKFSNKEFSKIGDYRIYRCFLKSFSIWKTHVGNKGQDLDTWNEEEK